MKVVFFDLETTGTLVNKHGIHQISGMIVIDGEVKVVPPGIEPGTQGFSVLCSTN